MYGGYGYAPPPQRPPPRQAAPANRLLPLVGLETQFSFFFLWATVVFCCLIVHSFSSLCVMIHSRVSIVTHRITYEEALATLQSMFGHMDQEVIVMILESNGVMLSLDLCGWLFCYVFFCGLFLLENCIVVARRSYGTHC
jgi:hypothetical protein